MAVFALIGVGELGRALAAGIGTGDGHLIRAFVRSAASARRAVGAGAAASATIADAVDGADVVLVAVPGAGAAGVAEEVAAAGARGMLYVDMASASPAVKEAAAARIAAGGGAYVDVAVLGAVAVAGPRVPMLASGPGAERWAALAATLGFEVRAVEAPAGHASRVKLLRSVYLKSRDALVLELMLAARRHGLEQEVIDSIGAPAEQVTFDALAERVLCSLALHAERRADELTASCELLEEVGVEPIVAQAAAQRLRALAGLRLSCALGGERPAGAQQVLAAIEARSGRLARV